MDSLCLNIGGYINRNANMHANTDTNEQANRWTKTVPCTP